MKKMRKVLLVHGFGLGPTSMYLLKWNLGLQGLDSQFYSYPFSPNKEDLTSRFLEEVESSMPDAIVGHSMGGVVAVSQMENLPSSVRSIICLGSPLRGSALARKEVIRGWPRLISPPAEDLLTSGVVIPKGGIPVGVIAGTSGFMGANLLYRELEGYHDGTVTVEETKVPGIADHITVDSGHAALLWNDWVAAQISIFLRLGHFVTDRSKK